MAGRSYERLPIEEFAHRTIAARDLDPVYDALVAMKMPSDHLARWLLAYWLCYHPGAACWLSERADGDTYWSALRDAAENEVASPVGGRWPRAPERRHWRGLLATDSVRQLRERYETAEGMVTFCAFGDDPPRGPERFADVARRVQSHYNFGPWIAYKVADMLERVWGAEVEFRPEDAMYEEPTKAALMVFLQKIGANPDAKPRNEQTAVATVCAYLIGELKDYLAPGCRKPGRPVGLQEVETVLCKWKSHMSGHYPLYNDLVEIRRGVEAWAGVSKTAQAFLVAFPPIPSTLVSSFSNSAWDTAGLR